MVEGGAAAGVRSGESCSVAALVAALVVALVAAAFCRPRKSRRIPAGAADCRLVAVRQT